MKKLTKLLTLLALLAMCLTLAACDSIKVDMTPYVSISYAGYNGNGTAYFDFDYASFEYEIMSQWDGKDDTFDKLADLTILETSITCTPASVEGLSNGDTVAVKVSINEDQAREYGYAIRSVEKTFTVEGLNEAVMIDPFDESFFQVSIDGTAPFAGVSLLYTGSRSDPQAHITYQAEPQYNLSNGDTVTITAVMSERYTEQGYLLTRSEMTVTVEGLDSYVSDASQLTASVLQSISDRACQECLSGNHVNIYDGSSNLTPWGASFENIHVGDTALLAVNNDIDMEYSFLLVPVYKTITTDEWYDAEAGENVTKTWENVVGYYKFTDLIVHTDGSVSYNESYVEMNGNYTSEAVAAAQYLNLFSARFTFTEVPLT